MTDKTTTNQQPQAPDYGEPWEVLSDRYDEYGYKDEGDYTFNIVRWNGCHEVNIDDETISHRIATCVNACAGLSNDELKNPLIRVGVLRNALQALGREQKAREKPGFEEEIEYEMPVEPGFCSISIDAKNLSKHKNIDILYNLVNKMAEAFEHGEDFSNLGVVAYNAIYQIKLNDKENK
jgi:hypothetical protein